MNDELLLKIDYNIFKRNILKLLWTEEDINKFCKFPEFSEYESTLNIYKISTFLISILLAISIYINTNLFCKLKKLNKNNNNDKEYELKEYLNK